jgi:hypothetical protein
MGLSARSYFAGLGRPKPRPICSSGLSPQACSHPTKASLCPVRGIPSMRASCFTQARPNMAINQKTPGPLKRIIGSAPCCSPGRASMRYRLGLNARWAPSGLALEFWAFPFPGSPRCEISETRQSAAHQPRAGRQKKAPVGSAAKGAFCLQEGVAALATPRHWSVLTPGSLI